MAATPSYQQGGWYNNPATGQNQRWMNGSFLPAGQINPGNNSSGNNNSSNGIGGDFNSFYQSALSQIQPNLNQQEAPLQSYSALLPSIYAQKKQSLEDAITGQTNIANSQISANNAQTKATSDQLTQQNNQNVANSRSQEANNGLNTSSTQEVQAENSYNQNLANNLTNLTARTQAQNGIINANLQNTTKQYQDMIAQLPNQQAKDALSVASQIASIQGQGINEAMGMAGNMLSSAIQQSYNNAMIALKQGDQQIALDTLAETASYHQALEGIQQTANQIKYLTAENQADYNWNQLQSNNYFKQQSADLANKQYQLALNQYTNPLSSTTTSFPGFFGFGKSSTTTKNPINNNPFGLSGGGGSPTSGSSANQSNPLGL